MMKMVNSKNIKKKYEDNCDDEEEADTTTTNKIYRLLEVYLYGNLKKTIS